mmetsp:Transcript_54362/g.69880  ORF Transcript_54362/g.69880 Transcript_54362/m.69880 type:complete len:259 (+) Transcript_54362:27-803(+)
MSESLPSLLDVIEAREQIEGGRESLTHLCYVATTTDVPSAIRFHEKAMLKYARGTDTSIDRPATGILLSQEGLLLHYIEAPAAITTAVLVAVQDYGRKKPWNNVRILVASEDCNIRYFDSWSRPRQANVADEGDQPSPSGEEATEQAFELVVTLANIGHKLSDLSFQDQSNNQSNKFFSGGINWCDVDARGPSKLPKGADTLINTCCPSNGRLKAFSVSDAFLTIDEFIDLFHAPISVHLNSEVTWPYQSSIDYSGLS